MNNTGVKEMLIELMRLKLQRMEECIADLHVTNEALVEELKSLELDVKAYKEKYGELKQS